MMTCLSGLPLKSGAFLVSSTGWTLFVGLSSSNEGSLLLLFSLLRLCTFFCPRVVVLSAALALS